MLIYDIHSINKFNNILWEIKIEWLFPEGIVKSARILAFLKQENINGIYLNLKDNFKKIVLIECMQAFKTFKEYQDLKNTFERYGNGLKIIDKYGENYDWKLTKRFFGIFFIYNKRYKLVFMARVLIEKIRKPRDI